MLQISNLHVEMQGQPVLKGLNLHIKNSEIHSIMGPNGSGKSTLFKAIAGHPDCQITQGEILYKVESDYENLLDLETVQRSKAGIFMSFQHPIEIPGVSNFHFLRSSFNSICRHLGVEDMDEESFKKLALDKIQSLKLSEELLDRRLNEGFSGGEKKKNELLQLAILSPRLALLDEIDSGLDIDSIKQVADGIKSIMNEEKAMILVTHYDRLLKEVKPDYVHILIDGQIKETGDYSLALKLDDTGYDQWI